MAEPDKGRVSLHPLDFEEALKGLLAVDPKDVADPDESDDEDGDDGPAS